MPRSLRPAAPSLSSITRPLLSTVEAATALGYSPSTLRHWASTGDGPIQPHRLGDGTHLRWRTNDVRGLAGMDPLPALSADDEAAAVADTQAREARDRALRSELVALRNACARIDALVGNGQLELPV
jgi:hypothetical protein